MMNLAYVAETYSFSIPENADEAALAVRQRVAEYFRSMAMADYSGDVWRGVPNAERKMISEVRVSTYFTAASLCFLIDGTAVQIADVNHLQDLNGITDQIAECTSFSYRGAYLYDDPTLRLALCGIKEKPAFQPMADCMASCMQDDAMAQHFRLKAYKRSESFHYTMVDHEPGRAPLYNEDVLQPGTVDMPGWYGTNIVTCIRYPETADASRVRSLMDELKANWGKYYDWDDMADEDDGFTEYSGSIDLLLVADEIDAFTAKVQELKAALTAISGSISMEGYLETQPDDMALLQMQIADDQLVWRSWKA